MMQLEVDGRRYGVASGETIVGSDPSSGIVLEGAGVQPRHLLVAAMADGSVAVRSASPGAEATLNGVALGHDPTPVLHGDKLRLGEREILVIDPAQAGATRLAPAVRIVDADALPPVARPVGLGPARLVSLTDGREYFVEDRPLVLGREASADVVVGSDEASRQHAEVRPTAGGYVLVDRSSNGTAVNGLPVEGSRVLARGDVIRIGDEEFRFSAEPAVPDSRPQLNDTLFGVPAFTPPSPTKAAPPLAALLVRSGALKGQRLVIRTPVANIGRADYNDVVVNDASVSSAHAKLQLRDDVWVLTDLGSTNGTFVDGEPALGEMPLGPGATIKVGAVRLMFEPLDPGTAGEPPIPHRDTRQMAAPEPVESPLANEPPGRSAAEAPAGNEAPSAAPSRSQTPSEARRPVRPPRAAVAQESRSSGTVTLVAVLALVAAAVIAYMLLS
jgi:pSer/pThr/pTyr-binding forkhead associated (FHA) protein